MKKELNIQIEKQFGCVNIEVLGREMLDNCQPSGKMIFPELIFENNLRVLELNGYSLFFDWSNKTDGALKLQVISKLSAIIYKQMNLFDQVTIKVFKLDDNEPEGEMYTVLDSRLSLTGLNQIKESIRKLIISSL